MKELLFRQCSNCSHIEDCPEPLVEVEDKKTINKPPQYCPKPDEIIMKPRSHYPDE